MPKKFSILITTKNRLEDLVFTLKKIQYLVDDPNVECVVFDDGSIDGTANYISQNHPEIILHSNKVSRGYLFCRNKMLNETKADYAISLDDDAHFVTDDSLRYIDEFFTKNAKIGLLGFRIYWNKQEPTATFTQDVSCRMKSFVGCGHVWRMSAWREIPNYPEWFEFYGEEDFASYLLFKKGWEIFYLPEVLVNHRVDIKSRKKDKDYTIRLRRSLRSGWYLYFLFYPINEIPKRFLYTLWMQLKLKVFQGDYKALLSILQALIDCIRNSVRLIKQRNSLTKNEFSDFVKLSDAKLYWQPEKN